MNINEAGDVPEGASAGSKASADDLNEPQLGDSWAKDASDRVATHADGRGYLGSNPGKFFNDMRGTAVGERSSSFWQRDPPSRSFGSSGSSWGNLFVCLGGSKGVATSGVCYATNGKSYFVAGTGLSEPGINWGVGWTSDADNYLAGDGISIMPGPSPVVLGGGITPNFGAVALQIGSPGLSATHGRQISSEQAREQIGNMARGITDRLSGMARFLDDGVRQATVGNYYDR